jgi:hypothetical protein
LLTLIAFPIRAVGNITTLKRSSPFPKILQDRQRVLA